MYFPFFLSLPAACCMDLFSMEMPAGVQHEKSDNPSLNHRLTQSGNKNATAHADQRITSSSSVFVTFTLI